MLNDILRTLVSALVAIALFAPMFGYLLALRVEHNPLTFEVLAFSEKVILTALSVAPFVLYAWLQKRFKLLRRYAWRRDDNVG